MRGAFFQIMLKSHIPTLRKKATIIILFYKLKFIYRPSNKIFNPHFQNKAKYKTFQETKRFICLLERKNLYQRLCPKSCVEKVKNSLFPLRGDS